MVTTLSRIIKYGLQSFRRNALLSVATIIIMVLALLVFQGLIMFNVITNTAITSLQDKIDISVFFKSNVPEDDILKLSRSLESLKEVKSVEYISRDKALEIFKEAHKDDPNISQALDVVANNPLLASLNIKAHDPNDYGAIISYLSGDDFKSIIDKVPDVKSRSAIDRLNAIVNVVERIGFGLTIFLAITAIIITFNTIRLAIYSNREEIGIMRLVGASNIFINGPYVVEVIMFGIFAAVISMLITAPFITLLTPYLLTFIPGMNLENYFYGNLLVLLGYQLLFGIFLGIISAVIAIRRYLRI